MKVSILGNGITSLSLAKLLANQGIAVDIYSNNEFKKNNIQTLGISKTNIDFFNEKILNIKKLLWKINKIEIYSENFENEKILDFFKNNEDLFFVIKNNDLYEYLKFELKKNKLVNFKKKINYQNFFKKNYNLIFNCDHNHTISKKFFYKNVFKNYNSFAYITVINHKKILDNHTASQIFTKKGPLAFLPISSNKTSIVYSIKGKKEFDIEPLISKYNTKYKIVSIEKILRFSLSSSNLRSYYYENIIAFGDLLHKIHPLAGQGFNMTIRDIKEIYRLILLKKELGLDLNKSMGLEFEKNTKAKNFLFSNSVDFIHEYFSFENKINNNFLSKTVKLLGKNKIVNNFFTKFADNGIVI